MRVVNSGAHPPAGGAHYAKRPNRDHSSADRSSFSRVLSSALTVIVFAALVMTARPWWNDNESSGHYDSTEAAFKRTEQAPPLGTGLRAPSLEDIEQEINLLARQAPTATDEIRAAYHAASDLYGFMMDILPLAAQGDGSAQYHIYLALGECRAYLGPNGDAALAESTLSPFWRNTQATDESLKKLALEQELWMREYHRCKNYVGAQLIHLELALAEELPGDISEYGPVWLERAYRSGYPLALVHMAQRTAFLSERTRMQIIQQAISSGDEEVFLTLFEEAWENRARLGNRTKALAWLILACHAGLDCSQGAYWYISRVCAASGKPECVPEQPAILHFWSQLSQKERRNAYHTALTIELD